MDRVALIAGEGVMPLRILEALNQLQIPYVVLYFPGLTDSRVIHQAKISQPIELVRLGSAATYCIKQGVSEVILSGRVLHRSIYSLRPWRMDWATLKLWVSMRDTRADALLLKVIEFLSSRGLKVVSSLKYLKNFLFSQEGPQKVEKLPLDVIIGVKAARGLGGIDAGQSVVAKKGSIVALEAMEGTDSCIERAFELCGTGATLVKLAKPGQDLRFDVPVVGSNTLKRLNKYQFKFLVVQSDLTLNLSESPEEILKGSFKVISLSEEEIHQILVL